MVSGDLASVKSARQVFALKHMTDELVGEAYQPLMLKFTDFDTIDERLGDKPIIVQEYAARTGGWTQCSFIPVERNKNGKNLTVMCTLRSITAEKEVESQGNLIQALAILYENIFTVNADTCEAVYYSMGQTMTERYGHKFAGGNYGGACGVLSEGRSRKLFHGCLGGACHISR